MQAWRYFLITLGVTIDPGYSKEIYALLHVLGDKDFEIEKGKDFIQLILDKNITPPVREVFPITSLHKEGQSHTAKQPKNL